MSPAPTQLKPVQRKPWREFGRRVARGALLATTMTMGVTFLDYIHQLTRPADAQTSHVQTLDRPASGRHNGWARWLPQTPRPYEFPWQMALGLFGSITSIWTFGAHLARKVDTAKDRMDDLAGLPTDERIAHLRKELTSPLPAVQGYALYHLGKTRDVQFLSELRKPLYAHDALRRSALQAGAMAGLVELSKSTTPHPVIRALKLVCPHLVINEKGELVDKHPMLVKTFRRVLEEPHLFKNHPQAALFVRQIRAQHERVK